MPGSRRRRRLELLLILATRLSREAGGGVLGSALDLLLDATAAGAGAAFSVSESVEQVAERGLSVGAGRSASAVRLALRKIAERSASARQPLWLTDLKAETGAAPEIIELLARGLTTLLAIPIPHRRVVLGVLLLLFSTSTDLDDETRAFVETVAHMTALAVDRDRRIEREQRHRAELEETGRMASLGLLTASVAHELRGPIGALVLQLEEQHRLLDQAAVLGGSSDTALGANIAELAELTDDIDTAIARVRDTVEQLSTLSRHDSDPEALDLSAVIHESLSIARPHLERRGITLIEQLKPACFTVGRPDNLGQVILNLVFNAADACERGGAPNPQIVVRTDEEPEHVVLSVDDTGPGVPRESIRTIFKPFFTTKDRGQGTGLGLKICADVVAAHGGHIEVQNRSEGGASFRVLLPRSDDLGGAHAVQPMAKRPAPQAPMTPPRKVLVVDDDPIFCRSLRRVLRPHDVRTASSASEAEITLLDPSYQPHVVLCDIFLPGTNGDALHARIVKRRPELARRFVFVTGGALDKQAADYIRASGCRTLLKPLQIQELRKSLQPESPDSSAPQKLRTLSNLPVHGSTRSTPTSNR